MLVVVAGHGPGRAHLCHADVDWEPRAGGAVPILVVLSSQIDPSEVGTL